MIPITVTVELNPITVKSNDWREHNFRALFLTLAHQLRTRPDLYHRWDTPTSTSLTVWIETPETKHIEDLSASEKLPALEQEITELKRQLSDVSARYNSLKHQIKMLNWSHSHD